VFKLERLRPIKNCVLVDYSSIGEKIPSLWTWRVSICLPFLVLQLDRDYFLLIAFVSLEDR
jgi:hypothetical protein